MARIYKTVQVDGEEPVRKLAFIECDRCDARIEPHPGIKYSGWVKQGVHYGFNDSRNYEGDFCPRCR